MRAIVVYDTSYGNTAVIAEAIRSGLGDDATAREVETLNASDLSKFDLLVIGSPTQSGRATPSVRTWISQIPGAVVRRLRFVAFDTRLPTDGLLGAIMQIVGHAAPRISHSLRSRGATEIAPAHGFIVTGKAGPLADKEKERAVAWGQSLARHWNMHNSGV